MTQRDGSCITTVKEKILHLNQIFDGTSIYENDEIFLENNISIWISMRIY